MQVSRRIWLIIYLISLVGCTEEKEINSPEKLVSEYFSELKRGGFNAVVPLFHPDELSRFKRMMLEPLREDGRENFYSSLRNKFGLETLEGMTDEEFISAFFDWLGEMNPEFKAEFLDEEPTIIGKVLEGETVHVLFRAKTEAGEIEYSGVDVMTFRLHEGKYRLLLNAKIRQLTRML